MSDLNSGWITSEVVHRKYDKKDTIRVCVYSNYYLGDYENV